MALLRRAPASGEPASDYCTFYGVVDKAGSPRLVSSLELWSPAGGLPDANRPYLGAAVLNGLQTVGTLDACPDLSGTIDRPYALIEPTIGVADLPCAHAPDQGAVGGRAVSIVLNQGTYTGTVLMDGPVSRPFLTLGHAVEAYVVQIDGGTLPSNAPGAAVMLSDGHSLGMLLAENGGVALVFPAWRFDGC